MGEDGSDFALVKLFGAFACAFKVEDIGNLVDDEEEIGHIQLTGNVYGYGSPLIILLVGAHDDDEGI